MKKLLKIFSFSLAVLTLFTCFSSANDCKQATVGNNKICVSIDKGSNHKYTVNSDITCNDSSCAVSCSILLPDNTLAPVGACNGKFYYDSNSSKKVKLYITINNGSKTIESYYDFGDGSWGDSGGGSSSYDNDEVELSANKTNPSTSEWIKLTINTDEDYVGKISFYKVQYRSSSSSSWTTISSRTNSTYFSNYSDEWEEGYYKMKSSDDGEKTINNFLKFAKKGYYRIYAQDVDGNYDYIDFNVGGSSSSDELELQTNDDTPSASEYVDLTVLTKSSYRGDINFSAKYRSSTSNSWTSISRTSSSYFISRSTTWDRGYITMTSSDGGEKNVENIFKFAKKGYYRIIAEDEDGYSTYIDFNVGNPDESPLDGFTQKEFEMVERIYNAWPTLISKLRSEYPKLKNNTTWKNLSDELYKNMRDVINKESDRKFDDYDDFDEDFRYRFNYTQRRMD